MRAPSIPSVSPRPSRVVLTAFVFLAGVFAPLLLARPAQAQPPWSAEIRAVLSQPAPVSRSVRAKQRRQARRLARERRAVARSASLRRSGHHGSDLVARARNLPPSRRRAR
jgi:hypothetical protein